MKQRKWLAYIEGEFMAFQNALHAAEQSSQERPTAERGYIGRGDRLPPQCSEYTTVFCFCCQNLQAATPQVVTEKGETPTCFREQRGPDDAIMPHGIFADLL